MGNKTHEFTQHNAVFELNEVTHIVSTVFYIVRFTFFLRKYFKGVKKKWQRVFHFVIIKFQFLGSLTFEEYVGFRSPKMFSLPCLSPHYPL